MRVLVSINPSDNSKNTDECWNEAKANEREREREGGENGAFDFATIMQ